jgi:hypothetical protein
VPVTVRSVMKAGRDDLTGQALTPLQDVFGAFGDFPSSPPGPVRAGADPRIQQVVVDDDLPGDQWEGTRNETYDLEERRRRVDLAVGVLMGGGGLTAEEAEQELQRRAGASGASLLTEAGIVLRSLDGT